MAPVLKGLATLAAFIVSAMLLQAVILPVAGSEGAALVLFAAPLDPKSLPEGVAILQWSTGRASLSGVDAEAARKLYGEGALLVFPIRSGGCMGLRKQDGRTVGEPSGL